MITQLRWSLTGAKAAGSHPLVLPALQRKCACGGTAGPTGECEECRKKRLRRRAATHGERNHAGGSVPPIVHDVLRSRGQPLDANTQGSMASAFGHDFSRVRIHADARAAASARAVNALAYTVGTDVVFGAGQFSPGTEAGRRLLGHELAHVVQQRGATVRPGEALRIAPAHDAWEQGAEGAAARLGRGMSSPVGGRSVGPVLQRATNALETTGDTGAKDAERDCAGWFGDRESLSKRAGEHYVRSELAGDRGVVERIDCNLVRGDRKAYACTVHFTDGTPIRVIVREDVIIVGVHPINTMHPPASQPLCWYDYRCPGANRDLVLTKRKCQSSGSPGGGGTRPPGGHGPEP